MDSAANIPTLIPRRALFGNPDKSQVQLSPDGRRIAFRAPLDGVMNVWVGPADDPSAAKPVTHDTGRGIAAYLWAYTGEHIVYIQDQAGDENWRAYSLNPQTGALLDLTPLKGVRAQIQGISQKHPTELVVGLNDRVPQFHDLYRIDVVTGARSMIVQNDGFLGFVFDDDYRVRLALRMTADGGMEYLAPDGKGAWLLYMAVPMEDTLTTGPTGFDESGKTLYLRDSRGRNTAGLFALDVETSRQSLLAEDSLADLSGVIVHPTTRRVQAAAFTRERKHWQILDPSIADDLSYLSTVADGDAEVVSRTLDDRQWLVAYVMDDGPLRFYRYDRGARRADFLFTHQHELEGLPLARMHPVVIPSRDGLDLVSYLTLPLGGDSDGDGRPDTPLPMVLVVHGGPWGRDYWGFNPLHQWLANRGYAVLSVNFRASTGLGKALVNAGNLEWGGKMHDDLLDAVDWAVEQGIAAPEKTAILGGSYGGYAVLWGLTATPETFACGVDIVGPSNLITLLESIPPYWRPQFELFAKRTGDPRTEEGKALLVERSPLTHVDRIRRPLLIGQGANDPRVKQAESDQIVHAMQERLIPVTYALYSDEGHGFVRPENNLSFFALAEAFLAEHLGGKWQPIGDDFRGSSIKVVAGEADVPGLAAPLAQTRESPLSTTAGQSEAV